MIAVDPTYDTNSVTPLAGRAVRQLRYGGPEALELTRRPAPVPAAGQVRVRVHAASLNARDWHVMRGEPRVARLLDRTVFGRRAPRELIRGTDLAGVVDAVGRGVTGWKVGDAVFGEGSGTFAVQVAKALGLHVTAVVSSRNVDLAEALGADEVIDYTASDFTQAARTYDAVVDLVGNRTLRELRRTVRPGGRLVQSGGGVSGEGRIVGPMRLLMGAMAVARFQTFEIRVPQSVPTSDALRRVAEMIEAGTVRPMVDRTFALEDVPAAIRYVEGAHARAKVVITVT